MYETEIKIKLRDIDQTRNKLIEMGALLTSFLNHTDVYYNMPEESRDFSKTDEALRLRSTIVMDPNTQEIVEENHDITYKGPKVKTIVKSRVEEVCRILDPLNMNKILLALGFRIVLSLPKKREVYHIQFQDSSIEVLLDEIEGLEGYYLEAEIQVPEKDQISETKEILIAFVENLGFSEEDSIRESYLELVLTSKTE